MDDIENKRQKCDVFSRVCGYCTRISRWNEAKQSEFKDRKLFSTESKDEITEQNIT